MRRCLPLILALLVFGGSFTPLFARVRLESICTVGGQREQKLVGLGLVVGLRGTGDGSEYLPTIQALATALKLLNNPVDRLQKSQNTAIVMIEATVPATGIRRGQKVDCFISAMGSAKSLRGGRLMVTPLQSSFIPDERVMGIASGAVILEDASIQTTGRVPQGVVIEEDFEEFLSLFIEDNAFTLLLDTAHSSFSSASEVARVVNADVSFEANHRQLAKAIGPGVVRVGVPEQYRDAPVDFIAQVLDVGIDSPQTQARVVLNAKTGIVVVTGEVELSPVVISHKNLTITVGDPAVTGEPETSRFVPLMEQSRQAPQQLDDLIKALNQLKVPTPDVIDIIKELHRSGKLHATVIVE